MSPKNRFILTVALLCLSACGFHLKGNLLAALLPVNTWSVQGGALQTQLEAALRHNQATISSAAATEVRVLHYDSKKDIYTITQATRVNEYLLSVRVLAQAYRDGKAWGQPIEVKVERSMRYTDSMILGKQYEEEQIWQEIQRDAAEQVVRQLAFLKDE